MINIDSFVVGLYLFAVLAIGFYHSKVKSFKEYSLARGNYPTPILVATIFATFMGSGATIGTAQQAYNYGVVVFLFVIGNFLYLYLLSRLAWRFNQYTDVLSVGELVKKFWGKNAQILCGLSGIFLSIAIIGVQVGGIGFVLNATFKIDYNLAAIIGCGVVIVYSSLGGIKAVTYTDVLQFAILIIAIPLIFNIALEYIPGNILGLYKALPESHQSLYPSTGVFFEHLWTAIILMIPLLEPYMVQRFLMASKPSVITESFKIAALVGIAVSTIIILIGLLGKAIYQDAPATSILPLLIHDFLPTGFKGFAIAGILAVIMSTADSILNASGILLVNDIIEPLYPKLLNDQTKTRLCKVLTFILGIGALYVALTFKNLLKILLFAWNFWGPTITVSLLFAVFGLVGSSLCFFSAAFSGILTVVLWKLSPLNNMYTLLEPVIPAMLVSAIVYYTIYKYERKNGNSIKA